MNRTRSSIARRSGSVAAVAVWFVLVSVPCVMAAMPDTGMTHQQMENLHEGCLTPPAGHAAAGADDCCDQTSVLKPHDVRLPAGDAWFVAPCLPGVAPRSRPGYSHPIPVATAPPTSHTAVYLATQRFRI